MHLVYSSSKSKIIGYFFGACGIRGMEGGKSLVVGDKAYEDISKKDQVQAQVNVQSSSD